jgi:hypothetical protein
MSYVVEKLDTVAIGQVRWYMVFNLIIQIKYDNKNKIFVLRGTSPPTTDIRILWITYRTEFLILLKYKKL